ncbi:hypothetical protein [Aquisphaera giovannonii]|nr:hypothetical protein [Aquisphaera giovannonii]
MIEEFEGYRLDDVTYCIDPRTNDFFPVRVVKVGRKFLDVEPLDEELAAAVAPEFGADRENRRFLRPKLPSHSRFGGCDERTVNAGRRSGQQLRVLPYHYWTYTGSDIIERHEEDAARWPLPTGVVYERWFGRVLKARRRGGGADREA